MRTFRAYQRSVLYDEVARRNVPWKTVADLVEAGERVRVRDAYSGEDVTAAAVARLKAERDRARTAAAAAGRYKENPPPTCFARVLADPPLRVGVSSPAAAEFLAELAGVDVVLESPPRRRGGRP